MKRTFDVVFSVLGLIFLSPLLLAISAFILVLDGRPILYRQKRIGFRSAPFYIMKFRTMVPDAEYFGRSLTVGRDPRVTKVGSFLRKIKLDELPQLINVLRGEMSFVGPRPEVERYLHGYTHAQFRVLELLTRDYRRRLDRLSQ